MDGRFLVLRVRVGRTGGWRRRWAAGVGLMVAASTLVAIAGPGVAVAAPAGGAVVPPAHLAPAVAMPPRGLPASTALPAEELPAVVWPGGGEGIVPPVAAGPAARDGSGRLVGAVSVGGLPVVLRTGPSSTGSTGAAGQVTAARVRVAGRVFTARAGVQGVLVAVSRADGVGEAGVVGLDIDYAGFGHAFGANFGSRLRVVRLPDCVLLTPEVAECRAGVPVAGQRNDFAGRMLTVDGWTVGADPAGRAETLRAAAYAGELEQESTTAEASSGMAVYAVSASGSSEAGDYAATSLSPTYSWSAGQQGGGFSYSYPFRMPPAPGGLVPSVALSYSSGAVDGLVASTNNQPSWVGEGWDYHPGYIERSYRSCREDGQAFDDLCVFDQDNLSIVLNGTSSRIVKDDDPDGAGPLLSKGYVLEADSGMGVVRLDSQGNGVHDGEAWKVWGRDGTQYFFGEDAGSVQAVEVFGDDAGEPCYATALTDRHCAMGYRWNLRRVVDRHGNQIDYFWDETRQNYNRYNGATPAAQTYDMSAVLATIEYGRTAGVAGPAPVRIDFVRDHRCVETGCESDHSMWYDTPWDLHCPQAWTSCPDRPNSPTFWSTVRLTNVQTKVLNPANGLHEIVDDYIIRTKFSGTGDGSSMSLQLAGITHKGQSNGGGGASIWLPEVGFDTTAMANRVNGAGQIPFNKHRLTRINSGTGAQTDVVYTNAPWSGANCTPTTLPASVDQNAKLCFPVWFQDSFQYFHKYVVSSVTETDLSHSSIEPEVTSYQYSTAASNSAVLWAHTMNENLPIGRQSWSKWAGFTNVRTTHGANAGTDASVTDRIFYRGLHGDPLGAGGSRSVGIKDSHSNPNINGGFDLEDLKGLDGFLRQESVYVYASASVPLALMSEDTHKPERILTSKRDRAWNYGNWRAYRVQEISFVNRWRKADGVNTWQYTEVQTQYDVTTGRPTLVTDFGDQSDTTGIHDNTCTRIEYATKVDLDHYLLDFPSKETVDDCATTPTILSEERTFYDGSATYGGSAITEGNVTKTEVLTDTATNPDTFRVTLAAATYDAYGRPLSATDGAGRQTSTAYTPTLGGPATATAVTVHNVDNNAATTDNHTTSTTHRYQWGLPATVTDVNGRVTELHYDRIGRLVRVDTPNPDPDPNNPVPVGADVTADITYAYTLRATGPNGVTVTTQNQAGNPVVATQIFDGRMRPKQTHTMTPEDHTGNKIVTDKVYDNRGLVIRENTFTAAGGPGTAYQGALDADIPTQNRYLYDRLGRPAKKTLYTNGTATLIETNTAYANMEWTTVTPPTGGVVTVSTVGPKRRLKTLEHNPTGAADQTTKVTYGYDLLGRQTSMIDGTGANTWSTAYTNDGLVKHTTDPDKGTTTFTHTTAGQVATSTDAEDVTLAYTYDNLGRKTRLDHTTAGGPVTLAAWVYDTLPGGKGQLTSSTRHDNGSAYTTAVTGYSEKYQPLGVTVTLPAAAGSGLADSWTTGYVYNFNGSLQRTSYEAGGGLPAETLSHGYDSTGRPTTLASALGTYIADTSFYDWGPAHQQLLGPAANQVAVTASLDEATGRLTGTNLGTGSNGVFQSRRSTGYDYTHAGTITRIAEDTTPGTAGGDTNQCFLYDGLQRLTHAWTTTATTCPASAPNAAGTGPDPYSHTWTYNSIGNRITEKRYTTGTSSVTDTYTYPTTSGAARPHAVTNITSTASNAQAFGYDNTGNTETRTINGVNQTLTYTPDGHLNSHTINSQATTYLYDADGNRLLRKDPNGYTTAFLGANEITRTTTGVLAATRYYGTFASRNSTSLTWLAADHHNTAQVAINSTDLAITIRRHTPFGKPREATPPTWQNPRGFLGQTTDPTGLTHLGAREYDPTIGKFLTVDPLLDLTDPQQWNGYTYANNNPINLSDPDGLIPRCGDDGQPACPTSINPGHSSGITGGGTRPPGISEGMTIGQATDILRPSIDTRHGSAMLLLHESAKRLVSCYNQGISRDQCEGVPSATGAWKPTMDPAAEILLAVTGLDGVMGCLQSNFDVGTCAGAGVNFIPVTKFARWGDELLFAQKCAKSFDGDTHILMADRTTKPISEIKIGDQVLATDPETGHTDGKTVTHIWIHDDTLVDLQLDGATITTTEDHPFYNATDHRWQQAQQLDPGDQLLGTNGPARSVRGLDWTSSRGGTAYNLTVADLHTYYVIAGNTPVLVHNTGPFGCGVSGGDLGNFEPIHGIDPNKAADLRKLSNGDLLKSFNDPADGGYVLVTGDGRIMNGHHRIAELQRRIQNGDISADVRVRIDEYRPDMPISGFWD